MKSEGLSLSNTVKGLKSLRVDQYWWANNQQQINQYRNNNKLEMNLPDLATQAY